MSFEARLDLPRIGNEPVSRTARPDYSHLSDEQLRVRLIAVAIRILVFAGLGLYGWWRFKGTYVPAPGRFTPTQALASVVAIFALVLLGAAVTLL